MMDNRCFVKSIAQVSSQAPLSDSWLTEPCRHDAAYVRAQEPDTSGLITKGEARRMSKILKRSVCTAITAINHSELSAVDAIITGTGAGCMENSERFLIEMSRFGENCLKPTLFMQSTHNTISSLIAIILKCHGYNNTYSHKELSFDSALMDAWLQIRSGQIRTVLAGSHDEVTPLMSIVLQNSRKDIAMISEASVSAVLSSESAGSEPLCEVTDVRLLHRPTRQRMAEILNAGDDGLMMLGTNGNTLNDEPYQLMLHKLDFEPVTIHYKPLFGEGFSDSAIAFYAGAVMLSTGVIPDFMQRSGTKPEHFDRMTIVNHTSDDDWSIIRLRRPSANSI